MKINPFCFYLFSICLISLIISSSSTSSVSLLGISPQDEDYFKTETIKCRNGSKKFTRAQLNDDFCDCQDGTDEPGTSACPQGKFYCWNFGHLPTSLPSSRVNDGICDCCDGSDEYDGKVNCPNTCWEAGKVARDKLQKKIDMYKQGVTLRKKEIEQAKRTLTKDREELSKLKNEEKLLKGLVKQLKVHKEQIEKLEEKEHLEKEKENKMKKLVEDKDEAGDESIDNQKESLTLANGKVGVSDESSVELEKDEYGNSEGSSEDRSESTEGLSREELGRLVASRWTGGKTGHQADEIGAAKNNIESSSQTSDSSNDRIYDNNDKESSVGNDLDGSNSVYKSNLQGEKDLSGRTTMSSSSWLEKIKDNVRNIFQLVNLSPSPIDKLDAEHVRKEYDDANTRLSDIEARISSLTEKLKHNFGTQNEFYLFYDQCFEIKQDKYVYKVCPFKEAFQEEGHHKTQLGEWEKFENSYRIMLFSNGERCWNGPDRNLKVKLRCGLKTELTNIDEPSRCEYVALMTTPVICLKEKLEELKHKLQAMHEEKPDGRDEL